MNTNKSIPTTDIDSTQALNRQRAELKYEKIKVAIDWHVEHYRVVRIIDGAGPEPAQRFKPKDFLAWMKKQLTLAHQVYSCYEAGAGGFLLHRELIALGVTNYVVAPRKLDPTHKGVVTDKTDARELALELNRYVSGNDKALQVVRAPTAQEEQKRQVSRQRQQMQKHLQSIAAQGRSLLLSQGYREKGDWWKAKRWEHLAARLPGWLVASLERFVRIIDPIYSELKALTRLLEQAAPQHRPYGMGALTLETLQREVCDWTRFKNRKGPASYSGLVGGVSASGHYHCDLAITKAGSIRVRVPIIQLAWRMVHFQSQSRLIQKWKHILLNPKASGRARKRAIVAVGRQLMVDLWRWQTAKITPEQLGWRMVTAATAP